MNKILGGLFFYLVTANAMAFTQSSGFPGQNWQLRNPLPDNFSVPVQDKKATIVIHVNRHLQSNDSLISDTVALTCGDTPIFFKAGATGSCDLAQGVSATVGIASANFHNGSEGTITIVE